MKKTEWSKRREVCNIRFKLKIKKMKVRQRKRNE